MSRVTRLARTEEMTITAFLNGWTDSGGVGGELQITRIGKLIHVYGYVAPPSGGLETLDQVDIFTLPSPIIADTSGVASPVVDEHNNIVGAVWVQGATVTFGPSAGQTTPILTDVGLQINCFFRSA